MPNIIWILSFSLKNISSGELLLKTFLFNFWNTFAQFSMTHLKVKWKYNRSWLLSSKLHHWVKYCLVDTPNTKGQLISEGNSGIFKSPKKRTKYFEGFLPSPLKFRFSIWPILETRPEILQIISFFFRKV